MLSKQMFLQNLQALHKKHAVIYIIAYAMMTRSSPMNSM